MNIILFLKDRLLLFLLHFACMMALGVFLLATGYQRDACLLILICWFLVLLVWITYEYRKRKQYFSRMEAVLVQIDQRFLLGELMPFSERLEDRIYREMIRKSNRSVIEKIHAAEETKNDYREYIESWVHEIKAPITSVALMCENHKSEVTRGISKENAKIENYVDMALYYARSDEVYKDYIIQETDLGAVAAEVVGRNKYYFIQNGMQVEIDCRDHVCTDRKWIAFILNQILQNSLKYRSESDAMIRIYTQKIPKGVRLVIEDNGIGIKEEEIPRIFEKNFTGTNGRNHDRSTGMGLYLCEKLCAKLGVGIHAESEEHVGTKMVLEFAVCTYFGAAEE
ncbi:MAG: sensor histidine kinase [Lachnospiraceae bacterium]|nr:sensor histidine kinase [Lachnospiraceae bacterium]MDE7272469.1 sensor histidine kinase [Lachnospiraceae bacterium]